jgi:Bacterial Ig-like domain (group 3)
MAGSVGTSIRRYWRHLPPTESGIARYSNELHAVFIHIICKSRNASARLPNRTSTTALDNYWLTCCTYSLNAQVFTGLSNSYFAPEINIQMKQTIVAVTMLLGCIGLAGLAKGDTVNDRYYVAGASPSVVAPGSTSTYNVSVTNDLKSGPSHFVRQVIVTVPTGFTLITSPGASSPVTPPPGWNLQSISGQTITVVTMSPTDTSMTAGKSVTIRITAQAPAMSGGCSATQSYSWQLSVNQDINGGVGNTYGLRLGTVTPMIVVASPDCLAPTNLVLNSVSPASLITTNTGTTVTITATLTSATRMPIPSEPVTFTAGGGPITCILSPAITNSSGIATCSYVPQASPNTPLAAGLYDVFANFAGDKVPNPGWGPSMSLAEQLTVNTDGTALSVADAGGPFNGTVNLTAILTTGNNQLPLSGKTITLYVNGVAAGSPQQTNNAGVVSVSNVSLAGIPVGNYPQFISASFAGDGTYSATSNSATLAVSQLPAGISWTSPAMDFVYGTPLSAAQLNATATLPGIFVYNSRCRNSPQCGQRPAADRYVHAERSD